MFTEGEFFELEEGTIIVPEVQKFLKEIVKSKEEINL